MNLRYLTYAMALFSATAVLAHQGVNNPVVKARMDAMGSIAENMKTLGQMAKGETRFDSGLAKQAALEIAEHAAVTPTLFEANETDPKSEARSEIWMEFEDFTAKALELEMIALELSKSISSKEDLGPAMQSLGGNCKTCHSIYRN